MKKENVRKSLVFLACIATSALGLSCVEKDEMHFEGVHSFVVEAVSASNNYGSVDAPLSSYMGGDNHYYVTLAAYAVDINGNLLSNYNGTVRVSAEPGQIFEAGKEGEADGTGTVRLTFKDGKVGEWQDTGNGNRLQYVGGGVNLELGYTFGKTRIWVEDAIYDDSDRVSLQEYLDQNGTGCPANKITEDGNFCEPSLASGTSREFVFEPQTIRMIQRNPKHLDGSSPLLKEYGEIKAMPGHDLVVTNVVSTGFYVTDKGDDDYNSIFIFTYSQPGRVDIGDRVCEVSGGIAEFTGMTQLQFPSWGIQNKEQSTAQDIDPAPEDGEQGFEYCIDPDTHETRPCTAEELEAKAAIIDCSDIYFPGKEWTAEEKKAFGTVELPDPIAVTSSMFFGNTNVLEAYEGSIVTVPNIRLSTEFVDCDDNGNSKIESGTGEATCRNNCTANPYCTELSSLTSYDQWRAWMIEGNGEVSVASSSLISGFDITSDSWTYDSVVDAWKDNGCEANEDGTMTCESCYEWKDANSGRRNIRCAERHLIRLTGNLKQVLPGCSGANSNTECYASKFRSSMVMSVIEPRFSHDLVFDEAYNKQAQIDFQECRADSGCLAACKISSKWCTCDAFAEQRKDATDGLPVACVNRIK